MVAERTYDWRGQVADRLMSAREAMGIVRPGDQVWVGGLNSTPLTLCGGLAERAAELPGVTVHTFLPPFNWDRPELLEHFTIRGGYCGPLDRQATRDGRMEYVPIAGFRKGKMPNGWHIPYDVAAIPISSPDAEGYCSFGGAVFFSPTIATLARQLVGEIHPDFIRTGGDNRIHISRFARLCEAGGPPPPPPIPPRSEETVYAAEVICTLTASELIEDRSTLQIGIGDVSAAMCLYLGDKHDLGIQTELLPGGVPDLVRGGVVTGRYKEVHPGKVVASVIAQAPPEDLAFINGNPDFELYDFTYTDDMRVLLQFEKFVAINNALFVDLTGNAASETWGPRVFSGSGGQPTFAYAASVTNAHSIIVLPSSQLVNGQRHTRIMATLPEGTTITAHRAFVDYVVTEQGIATLTGKTLRQRIDELVSVAHPDFRTDLRVEARKMYGV